MTLFSFLRPRPLSRCSPGRAGLRWRFYRVPLLLFFRATGRGVNVFTRDPLLIILPAICGDASKRWDVTRIVFYPFFPSVLLESFVVSWLSVVRRGGEYFCSAAGTAICNPFGVGNAEYTRRAEIIQSIWFTVLDDRPWAFPARAACTD